MMVVSRTEEECKLSIEGEDVKKLKYLGAMISADGMCDEEIEQRVEAAAKVVGAMQWWCPPSSMRVRHGLCRGGTRARYRHVK